MIFAGFALLAVGAVDLVRQFVPRRWIGYLVILVLLMVLGSVSDALLPMLGAILIAAAWAWTMPRDRDARAGFWPAVALAFIVALAVVWVGGRADAGMIGAAWDLSSPFGPIPFDLAVLVVGVTAFLLESGNLVVRAALSGEHTWRPADAGIAVERADLPDAASVATSAATVHEADTGADAESAEPVAPAPPLRGGFKGGRLIGPLERIIVLLLTLAMAYPILAAMLAAKGIVRFPEISKDGETGARAEYFLVGSLVSWVIALGAAFLVWWGVHS
ncbi:hypothetical protein [Microbacterium sp. CIAB417]|uniref:hypothetical protein n=1 Tax=Microbacterium sp. CIAB417 TaxID=2860287 RepID=UPI001FAB3B10|nr:hypothetical protein [Microbacterium sp. CIAB417]